MKTKIVEPHNSSLGMNANIAAILVFAASVVVSWIPFVKYFAWLVPIVFFILEKNSGFVRFYAVNCFVLYAIDAIIAVIFAIITGIVTAAYTPKNIYDLYTYTSGALAAVGIVSAIALIIGIFFLILAILCIVNAYSYKEWEMPILGGLARKLMPMFEKLSKPQASAVPQPVPNPENDASNNQNLPNN